MSCGIYKITNLINKKVYIGQSINIEQRWAKHRNSTDDFAIHKAFRKYGIENFDFEILEKCSQEQLDEKEKYWIEYYDSLNNGYNMIPGGSNGAGYAKGKAVEQYSLDGKLIATYPSAHQAGEVTGIPYASICHCCKGEIKTTGLFLWKYADSDKKITSLTVQDVINRGRAVNQYSLDGEFIKQYASLKEASLETGINKSSICRVCKKNGHTAGGFKWAYAGETISSKNYKRVGQYDIWGI